jgi:hypothetical protein
MRLHRQLDGIADKSRQSRMAELKSSIQRTYRNIGSYRDEIKNLYALLEGNNRELTALEAAPVETNDAMFNFFNSHKQVTVLYVYDSSLVFGVDDTLEFYDEDEFERIFNSGRSYLSDHNADVRKALWAIFKKRLGVIRIQAEFDLYNFRLVQPRSREKFIENCMPNPHIYYHACSGGNEIYYDQYAESGDWDLAVEQAISATKNLNWGDSVVGSEMVSWLIGNDKTPCIYVSEDLSPIERVNKDTMKLISFREFKEAIKQKKGEENDG